MRCCSQKAKIACKIRDEYMAVKDFVAPQAAAKGGALANGSEAAANGSAAPASKDKSTTAKLIESMPAPADECVRHSRPCCLTSSCTRWRMHAREPACELSAESSMATADSTHPDLACRLSSAIRPSRHRSFASRAARRAQAEAGALVVHQGNKALVPTATGGKKEYMPSAQLAKRIPSAWPRPVWHAPWRMYRVVAGHLGWAPTAHHRLLQAMLFYVLVLCLLPCWGRRLCRPWQQHALASPMKSVMRLCRWVRSLAVDPGNEFFATGSADRTIKIWDLASGQLKLTLTGHIEQVWRPLSQLSGLNTVSPVRSLTMIMDRCTLTTRPHRHV